MPPEQAAPTDDPLKAVVVDIVNGWGELTREDTNRLDLFRPDKVLAVAETIELPKDDASGGYARTRLLGVRKYAADKQTHTPPPEVSSPDSEPIEETAAVRPETGQPETTGIEAVRVEAEGSPSVWESPGPKEVAAGSGLAGAGLATVGLVAAASDGRRRGRPD